MTYTYPYELVNGHIIVIDGHSRLLIDTGSPFSIADASPLVFADRTHTKPNANHGITLGGLREMVETTFNAFVGTDILNLYDILIDPTKNSVSLTEDEMPLSGQPLDMTKTEGAPVVRATVGVEEIQMFFDTGAKVSYLISDKTKALQSVGTESDFYMGHKPFDVPTFDVPVALGKENIILRVGNLPQDLEQGLLRDTGIPGIIGSAILQTHKVVLAPRRMKIAIQRINE